MSLKWHPDKNMDNAKEAEEIFKKITYAYDILSDEKKRKEYEMFGSEHMKYGGFGG